jgi:hypothetical protein
MQAPLVFKAVLDLSQGYSPLASVVAALFLLGVEGIWNLATGSWLQTGSQYGATDMLMSAFGYAANRISAIVGGFSFFVSCGSLSTVGEWLGEIMHTH